MRRGGGRARAARGEQNGERRAAFPSAPYEFGRRLGTLFAHAPALEALGVQRREGVEAAHAGGTYRGSRSRRVGPRPGGGLRPGPRRPAPLPALARPRPGGVRWAAMGHRLTPHTLDNEAQLRALLGEPTDLVQSKTSDRLNPLTRRFIELSPFLCLSTSAADGSCDVSPRGDPAGFVHVLDDRTLLIPERPGNRLADSLRNILGNPRVGLLFLIPGVGDSFRINGRATLTTDPGLLADSAVEGKAPRLGILVDVEEAFMHCSKAAIRSDLWAPARFVDRSALPTGGEMLRAVRGDDFDSETYDRERAGRYARREGFY